LECNAITVDLAVVDVPSEATTSNAIQTSITAQKIELLLKGVDFTSILKAVPDVNKAAIMFLIADDIEFQRTVH
jgi:hypothetical protein